LESLSKNNMKKPVNPTAHGVMDYLISGIEIAAIPFLGLNSTAARTYQAIGAGYTLINALTKTPVGVRKLIPLKTHQKGDLGLLAGLALLSFAPFIRKDRRALFVNLGILGITALQYALTDYNREK
jgi:hypothetical protein